MQPSLITPPRETGLAFIAHNRSYGRTGTTGLDYAATSARILTRSTILSCKVTAVDDLPSCARFFHKYIITFSKLNNSSFRCSKPNSFWRISYNLQFLCSVVLNFTGYTTDVAILKPCNLNINNSYWILINECISK